MLILSRKESETVLLPTLGISIEVTQIKGRTVQLGIQAPKSILILRGELEDAATCRQDDWEARLDHGPNILTPTNSPVDTQDCLNDASLAVQLAKNQLGQGRTEYARNALEHALKCLENLEQAILEPVNVDAVHESKRSYKTAKKKTAVCVDLDSPETLSVQSRLDELGYQTLDLNTAQSLIEILHQNDQPDLILTKHNADETKQESGDPLDSSLPFSQPNEHPSLRVFGIGSLQRSRLPLSIGDSELTGWLADPADADAVSHCFDE
jgi:carbon storage regulator